MRRKRRSSPLIQVLAGTNGAGKSSVAGAMIRARNVDYFNPDEATRKLLDSDPGMPLAEANSRAWKQGKRLLETAIASRRTFAFETTLGGHTIPALLERAHSGGIAVRVWFVGLEGVQMHLDRVRSRVAAGGHDIPEEKIRERYDRSRENLIRLLPVLSELRLFDNSAERDPHTGAARPWVILSMTGRRIVEACPLADVPEWAKPIVTAVRRLVGSSGSRG